MTRQIDMDNQGESFGSKAMPYITRWYIFLISLIICLGLVWLYLELATPLYKISSTLLIQDDKKDEGILKSTAFSDLNMFEETKTADNEIEILRSRDLIYKAIKKLNLETSYYDAGTFNSKEIYSDESPFKVNIVRLNKGAYLKTLQLEDLTNNSYILSDGNQKWKYDYGQIVNHPDYSISIEKNAANTSLEGSATIIRFRNLQQLASAYSAGLLKVNPVVKESNTIILTINDNIPQRGVDLMNAIIDTYNAENVEKKNIMAINTILFIDKRLKTLEHDLSLTEGDIESFKQQNDAVDADAGTQVNLTKSAEYNSLIEESDVQLGVINSIQSYLGDPGHQFNIVPSTMGLKDPVLNTLIGRFNDVQIERNRMLNSAKPNNPLVQNLSDQIANLRLDIMENLGNIKEGFIIENNHLKSNSAQYKAKIQAVPTLERGLLERSREQSVKTSLYQYLLQKREETALSLSATIPTSQVIDRPAFNSAPEYPKQSLSYLCGIIIGLVLPGFTIYARQHLNEKIKSADSIKSIAGAKILGELSHNTQKGAIAVHTDKKSTISELFRYIRTNLGVLNPDFSHKVMLVTSCMKGEGKTFFSINLALTLALLDKKVLVIEFDLRKPDLLKKMGMDQNQGITDYLNQTPQTLLDLIEPYPATPNLYVLGCGPIPENPAELLMSSKIKGLFDLLKLHFDYIIVDTSPVGQVADAFSLARYADLSIYLVRYNFTNKQQLDILKDIYDNNRLKNLMVVFNDAKKENRPAYAYGGYGYATENSNS